jgi:quercetin dioxygenase-like cupin family protein
MLKRLIGCLALLAFGFIGGLHAQAPASAIKRAILQRADVPSGAAYEVVLGMAEVPAGALVGKHMHPGVELGMLIEGEATMMIDGQPERTLKPGDSYQIAAGVAHDAKAGSAGAKVIAVYTVEKGKPLAVVVK